MSSDLYVVDPSFYSHSSPEIVSSDGDQLFFSDPFSHFCDSSLEFLQEFSDNLNTQHPVENPSCRDNLSPSILSSSPPSHQLENLTLYQTPHVQVPVNGCSFANGYGGFSVSDALEVKTEECQVGFDSSYVQQSFMPHSYSEVESVAKMMQRSYSSNSFDGKPRFLFQPRFDTLLESPNYQNHSLSCPENNFLASHLRRVCSTGDLQNVRASSHATQRSLSSHLASESSFIEEANFKVGRYSAEERKERISKYRAKRNQRNFTKTIKYACRKTLADNRPRIRGRFARNDEPGEIPKAACSTRDDEEDELWFDGLHEEEDIDGQTMKGSSGTYNNNYGQPPQFQYYGY